MIEKPRHDRPIDKVRNSGGSMKLPEGAGEIDGMQEIDGSLHFIARKAIVRMQLADQIDPDRVNTTFRIRSNLRLITERILFSCSSYL